MERIMGQVTFDELGPQARELAIAGLNDWYVSYRLNLQTSLAESLAEAQRLFDGDIVLDEMDGPPYVMKGVPKIRLMVKNDM